MYYFDELNLFYRKKLEYFLVGGLAVNLHGIPRTTQDIDIVVSFKEENIRKLIDIVTQLDYIPRVPVDPILLASETHRRTWINEKNMKVFSFYNRLRNFKMIDVLITSPLLYEDGQKNMETITLENISINIVGIQDLVVMKRNVARKQDLSDVALLEKLIEFRAGKKGQS